MMISSVDVIEEGSLGGLDLVQQQQQNHQHHHLQKLNGNEQQLPKTPPLLLDKLHDVLQTASSNLHGSLEMDMEETNSREMENFPSTTLGRLKRRIGESLKKPAEKGSVHQRSFDKLDFSSQKRINLNDTSLQRVVQQAWLAGAKAWQEVEDAIIRGNRTAVEANRTKAAGATTAEPCPAFLSMTGKAFENAGLVIFLPCGLMFGSAITLVGKPREAHMEFKPPIARVGEGVSQYVMVSQFVMELQGLKVVDGEDPPRILHINPRLRGDWSWKPVIEHNTCYRGQWGTAQRCEGWQAPDEEELVDGQLKCEKWLREDDSKPQDSKKSWWLNRSIGHSGEESLVWDYPFAEGRLFVLTISAGLEGFHLMIDGRHITSFPYRLGYVVEEATGVSVGGDVEVHSVMVTSLPTMHPSYYNELILEEGEMWKAPKLPMGQIELFVGIMSSTNHFAERMAVRKTWLQSPLIRSSRVVARFFVALHANKEINLQVKKEADYYRDMVVLPFIDRYDIVVLKTIAICQFGVENVTAKYVMKCDDDTFVRVDRVLEEVKAAAVGHGLYMGSMNEFHRPLRSGKWAVTYEDWPERIYPTYANGPGYILSEDIVCYILSEKTKGTLRLFKMEDVSVGLWVGQYGREKHVQYEHSPRFAQAGCVDHYLTAHYQSPRQMLCLWNKLLTTKEGKCCHG